MSTAELLAELQTRGLEVTANGSRLKIRAPKGAITPEIRARLTESKPEILAALLMPRRPELERTCRRACRDFPDVDPSHLAAFLIEAQDARWATERVARHLARRMSEGLIRWEPRR